MSKSFSERLLENPVAVVIVGLLIALVFAIFPLLPSVRPLIFLLSGYAFWWGGRNLLRWLHGNARPPFPGGGDVFPGFRKEEDFEDTQRLDRTDYEKRLQKRIEGGRESLLAVTGESGAGKSFLAGTVEKKLKNDGIQTRVVSFAQSTAKMRNAIKETLAWLEGEPCAEILARSEKDPPGQVVVFLDQFEHCLDEIARRLPKAMSLSEALDDESGVKANKLALSMRALLQKSRQDAEKGASAARLRIVVVVRAERFFDLRLFRELAQTPSGAFEVMGFSEEAGFDEYVEKLRDIQVTRPLEIAQALLEPDGTLLPVKAQIAGSILESKARTVPRRGWEKLAHPAVLAESGGEIDERDLRELGGPKRLSEAYFRQVLEACPNSVVARDVLYLLSIERRVDRSWSRRDLERLSLWSSTEIDEAMKALIRGSGREGMKDGPVRWVDGGVQLKHDYLARAYHELSGQLMDPVSRDNLTAAYENQRRDGERRGETADKRRTRVAFATQVAKFLLLAWCSYRLMYAELFPPSPAGVPVAERFGWDWYYLPLMLAQVGWAIYALDLVRNTFAKIDETMWMRLFSYLVLAVVLVGGVWTSFDPGLWFFFIGASGIAVSLKFLASGFKIRRANKVRRERFTLIGIYCLLMSSVWAWLGWHLSRSWDRLAIRPEGWKALFVALEQDAVEALTPYAAYYAVIILVVGCGYLYYRHATATQGVQFVGLYKRAPSGNRR